MAGDGWVDWGGGGGAGGEDEQGKMDGGKHRGTAALRAALANLKEFLLAGAVYTRTGEQQLKSSLSDELATSPTAWPAGRPPAREHCCRQAKLDIGAVCAVEIKSGNDAFSFAAQRSL